MADQATSVEEREGTTAGGADQQGELLLLQSQPAVLRVGQVGLGPLDQPGQKENLDQIIEIQKEDFKLLNYRIIRIVLVS